MRVARVLHVQTPITVADMQGRVAGNARGMSTLLRLPIRAAEIATAPPRFAVKTLLSLLRDDDEPRGPVSEAPAPHYEQRAAERARRRSAPPKPKPKRKRAAREGRITRPAQPPDGPGPEIHVAEPWKGYDAMTEEEVLERLVGADPTLRAAVRLYESANGGRRQVLIATEEPVAQP
jgi:hypothetical protein